ncbi:thermonuclease family protein [Thiobaca trueperi]|uniref:Endonuclease YncB(Thermonuclease family) n=1 Tax=Thiobaca trueperi TaxID=127458 RepID=A0A4R3MXX3_9GAMM|nr:thermonuclease family protein [Thiobaca trueperi]TCT21195.1 endonuclease YncB(thermonuclease family) [Thiobaca trueperi]
MSEIMRLTYTYDGDTLGARRTLNGADEQVRIRLAYLDAPEIDQGNWGIRARAYLRSLLVINEHIAVQIKGRDDYGRLIAEVLRTRDYGNCGLRLVLGGYVALWQCPATQPAYWAAQDMARDARRGIWAVPGLHQTPWLAR